MGNHYSGIMCLLMELSMSFVLAAVVMFIGHVSIFVFILP